MKETGDREAPVKYLCLPWDQPYKRSTLPQQFVKKTDWSWDSSESCWAERQLELEVHGNCPISEWVRAIFICENPSVLTTPGLWAFTSFSEPLCLHCASLVELPQDFFPKHNDHRSLWITLYAHIGNPFDKGPLHQFYKWTEMCLSHVLQLSLWKQLHNVSGGSGGTLSSQKK